MESHWKQLWDTWDLRGFIILSLSLQTFLTFVAPLRKRVSSSWIIMPLWSAYLLADWAANFAVGLISHNNYNTSGAVNNGDLQTFWVTFLLLHLGGPDTITAFALEDNELWLRHLLALIVQSLAAVYVFFQTFHSNKLWIPTMLVFVAGIIKYSERTRSLYLASLGNLRESMRRVPPVYHKVVKEFYRGRAPVVRINREGTAGAEGVLEELEVISEASSFFDSLKELIVNSIVTFKLDDGEYLFRTIMAGDAFGIIELELNLIYEILYTKVSVVHCKSGYICRSVCFSSVVVALALFHSEEKQGFDGFDVGITYVLLLGAIVLDIIAIVMLFFSNSTIITLMSIRRRRSTSNWVKNWVKKMLNLLLAVKRRRRRIADAANPPRPCCMLMRLIGQFLHRGWSESVSQFNLINYCIHKRPRWMQKLIDIFHLTNIFDRLKYVKSASFTRELRNFIFKELLIISRTWRDAENAKEIYSGRGEGVLRDRGHNNLLPSVEEVEYDRSLLLWHIATELCYSDTKSNAAAGTGDDDDIGKYRNFSKLLSDYMLYLLVIQQQMMAAVAGDGYIRFIHTCSETKHIFQRRKSQVQQEQTQARPSIFAVNDFFCREKSEEDEQIGACNTILSIDTTFNFEEDIYVKSVLFDACRLAKALRKLAEKDKWETISSVWVELLCHAASRCGAYTHVQQLNKGGELITLVWLLMVHLGLCGRFQEFGSFQPLNFNPGEEQVEATPVLIRGVK
ncbi:uncharacterized protein LOC132305371 [Cornus florida]|uniref:uncharacterized protein LOC132305371 n=1 Tax=Cornus florida TaxID=4283 RepID=UPI00289C9385|nr:uncharacterized protein LOC132305371 [Cornus florida]